MRSSLCMYTWFVDGKLQEQLNVVRKEITRLEYQNNELEQVRLHQFVWGRRILFPLPLEIWGPVNRGLKVS